MATQLFEEERHVVVNALIAQIEEPSELGLPTAGLALPTGNQPVDPRHVQIRERTQKGLGGHEPYHCGNTAQVVNAPSVFRALHRDTHPDIVGPWQLRRCT